MIYLFCLSRNFCPSPNFQGKPQGPKNARQSIIMIIGNLDQPADSEIAYHKHVWSLSHIHIPLWARHVLINKQIRLSTIKINHKKQDDLKLKPVSINTKGHQNLHLACPSLRIQNTCVGASNGALCNFAKFCCILVVIRSLWELRGKVEVAFSCHCWLVCCVNGYHLHSR